MTIVGWTPYKYSPSFKKYDLEFTHNTYFPPEKISDIYKDTKSEFKRCPANKQFLKNFWMIRSPFDVELNINRKDDTCRINQNQRFFDAFIFVRWGQYTETDLMSVSFSFQYMFVADEPVWIELYPAFLHGEPNNTRLISGTFDIYNWQRPVDFSFEVLDDQKPIMVKRGQPLFYVRFLSNKLNDDFKLQEIEWTDELLKLYKRCSPQNWVEGLSWKLMKAGNRHRPKKLIK